MLLSDLREQAGSHDILQLASLYVAWLSRFEYLEIPSLWCNQKTTQEVPRSQLEGTSCLLARTSFQLAYQKKVGNFTQTLEGKPQVNCWSSMATPSRKCQ